MDKYYYVWADTGDLPEYIEVSPEETQWRVPASRPWFQRGPLPRGPLPLGPLPRGPLPRTVLRIICHLGSTGLSKISLEIIAVL